MAAPNIVNSPNTLRAVLWLALPVLAEETLMIMVVYTDWWLTGNYLPDDDAAKAAMGLMAYMMWLIPSMFAAIAIGATALIARYVGSGDRGRAVVVVNQAVMLGALLAVFVTVSAALFAEPFIEIMHLKGQAAKYALRYALIISPVIPLIMFEQVGAACLRGAGDTVTGFLAKSVVVVCNILVSISLVIGIGPMPKLGWPGIATGTAVGHSVGGLIILMALLFGRVGLKLHWRKMLPNFNVVRKLMRIGIPGGADIGALLLCQLIYVRLINALGTQAAAAHGLGVTIEALAYLPGSAFQVAAATTVGQFLGAKNPKRAGQSALLCLGIGGGIMCTAGLLFFFGGHWFTFAFTGSSDNEIGLLTIELLKIVAVSMPSLAVIIVLNGALRGAGDTTWPFIFTLFGFVALRIPLALWFANEGTYEFLGFEIHGLGWGVQGAWIAMVVDLFVRSVFVAIRFIQGGWKRIKV